MLRVRFFTCCLVNLLAVATAFAQAEPAKQPQPAAREKIDAQIAKARERMRQDSKKYSREQLQECENLYQVANKNWRTPEAVSTLKVMVEKYPDVNRTGCAVLYLAQMSKGDERAERLKQCIEKYGDCWYGDGAQVGALARYYRALDLQQADDKPAVQKLFDELARDYPDAITHRGVLLADAIKQAP